MDIINTNVNVVVDPLRVIFENFDSNYTEPPPKYNKLKGLLNDYGKSNIWSLRKRQINCVMSVHRNNCNASKIRNLEQITWDTRICFKWKCFTNKNQTNLKTYKISQRLAIRIENCWTGSIRNPIFIINKSGLVFN